MSILKRLLGVKDALWGLDDEGGELKATFAYSPSYSPYTTTLSAPPTASKTLPQPTSASPCLLPISSSGFSCGSSSSSSSLSCSPSSNSLSSSPVLTGSPGRSSSPVQTSPISSSPPSSPVLSLAMSSRTPTMSNTPFGFGQDLRLRDLPHTQPRPIPRRNLPGTYGPSLAYPTTTTTTTTTAATTTCSSSSSSISSPASATSVTIGPSTFSAKLIKDEIEEPECPLCHKSLVTLDNNALNVHVDTCLNRELLGFTLDRHSVSAPNLQANPRHPRAHPQGVGSVSVVCPYPGCGLMMEQQMFPSHTYSQHFRASNQHYICPICALQGGMTRHSDLIKHLQSSHSDLLLSSGIPTSAQAPKKSSQEHTYSPPAVVQTSVPNPSGDIYKLRSTSTSSINTISKPEHVVERSNQTEISRCKSFSVSLPPQSQWNSADDLPNEMEYVVHIQQEDSPDEECSICYVEFLKGDKLARMQCWCLYHVHCIEKWFSTKKRRACPLHSK